MQHLWFTNPVVLTEAEAQVKLGQTKADITHAKQLKQRQEMAAAARERGQGQVGVGEVFRKLSDEADVDDEMPATMEFYCHNIGVRVLCLCVPVSASVCVVGVVCLILSAWHRDTGDKRELEVPEAEVAGTSEVRKVFAFHMHCCVCLIVYVVSVSGVRPSPYGELLHALCLKPER